jgi:hypothetical protein
MGTKSKRRRQQFLAEHPTCYLCGGLTPAATVDHVPPRACFPRGYAPDGFEFAACDACNQLSRAEDKIFGFWAMALDFDPAKMKSPSDRERIIQLMQDLARESPEHVAEIQRAHPVSQVGNIVTPKPVAFAMKTPDSFGRAAELISIKLTHALYFREAGKHLSARHRFMAALYQPQVGGTEHFTSYLMSLLPNRSVGSRINIKEYGDRFAYKNGYDESHDFFCYLAQFGRGLMIWGVACGPNVEKPNDGPLAKATWHCGAWGATAGRGANQFQNQTNQSSGDRYG